MDLIHWTDFPVTFGYTVSLMNRPFSQQQGAERGWFMNCEFLTVATLLKKNLSNMWLMHSHPVFCVPSVFLPVYPLSISEGSWVKKVRNTEKGQLPKNKWLFNFCWRYPVGGGLPHQNEQGHHLGQANSPDAIWPDEVMRETAHHQWPSSIPWEQKKGSSSHSS